jgi:antitoxin (DNA-binding transcriptional repressor) of toxin-antitoxin stability system
MSHIVVNICEDKTQLSRLVDRAAGGENIVIAKYGRPIAKLSRLEPTRRTIIFGLLQGQIEVPDDFDAPLPNEVRSPPDSPSHGRATSPLDRRQTTCGVWRHSKSHFTPLQEDPPVCPGLPPLRRQLHLESLSDGTGRTLERRQRH